MHESMMPFPWPPEVDARDRGPDPTEECLSKRERRLRRYVGPTGGILIDPSEIAKRRAAQKAQRTARRRNRRG